ncbi:MAG: hypothetical protein RL292_174 [Candidatus Parcubacteria bacterium]|jgi:hypothetical protein
MDYNHPDIQIYLQNLPPTIQKCIGSAEWKVKIVEIGKKYSLQPAQISNLEMETLLVAIGVESDQEMVENIKSELDISDILAEQLAEDVNQRIYKWIYKQLSSAVASEEKDVETNQHDLEINEVNALDVPPPNLPGEVMGEVEEKRNEFVVKPMPIQDQVKDFFAPKEVEVPVVTAAPNSFIRPMETPPEKPIPQKPQSFISQKLSQPTAPQKYTADPYREPIE